MSIEFRCKNCGRLLSADDKDIGEKTVCPGCGNELIISGVGEHYQRQKVMPLSDESRKDILNKSVVRYAGFWIRFIAAIIDGIILSIAGLFVGGLLGAVLGFLFGLSGMDMGASQVAVMGISYITGTALQWLYFTLFESSSKQATPGKMAMGILVTDLDGRRISFGRANGRYWGKIISGIILMIGYIMAGFTEKKQALHDILAGCLVVRQQ